MGYGAPRSKRKAIHWEMRHMQRGIQSMVANGAHRRGMIVIRWEPRNMQRGVQFMVERGALQQH